MSEPRANVHGLYGIADAEASGGDPVRLGAAMLAGCCGLLQLRCKGWPADDVVRAAIDLVALCRAAGATLIVNDDPQVAAASGAHGVHLGQLDGTVAEARKVLRAGAIVGRSTGDLDQLRLAVLELQQGGSAGSLAAYVAFGPIWDTPHLSRPKPVRGVERLREARAIVPASMPLVAIGGVTAARLPEVRAAGADAWAVIGAIASAEDPVAATRSLR